MFGWFKQRKKIPDIVELKKLADENNKDAQYQLYMAYYRDTSLAQKKQSKYSLEKESEEDK